ncbi:hypothetical protein [uncultured Winogradskyella sp.]|uniref:hypothetical protein n=1 Tax=uncultured Winogradskyella sp. TaxID=395353 RepID=UPI003518AEFB
MKTLTAIPFCLFMLFSFWVTAQEENILNPKDTIHAFEIDGDCESNPAENALVTVWARSDAHERANDYGTTKLCECADEPNTPAVRGKKIQCQLTKLKF